MNSKVLDASEEIGEENYYRDRIVKYIEEELKISVDDFCSTFVPNSITKKFFRGTTYGHPKPGDEILPYKLKKVYKLVFNGIPRELLLLRQKDLDVFLKNNPEYANYSNKSVEEKQKLEYFVSVEQPNFQNDTLLDFHLVENRDTAMTDQLYHYYIKYIGKASNELIIEEFLGKGNNKTDRTTIPSYKKANDKIFEFIEDKISNGNLENYTRLLALPPDPLIFGQTTTLENQHPSLVLLCSSDELFKHMCRCFTLLNRDQYSFYAKPSTSFVQFHLIDSNYLLLETYLYQSNTSEPNFLIAYRNSPNTPRNKMFEMYSAQATNFCNEQRRITSENICTILKGLETYIVKTTDELEILKSSAKGLQKSYFDYIRAVFKNYSYSILKKIQIVEDDFPTLIPTKDFFK